MSELNILNSMPNSVDMEIGNIIGSPGGLLRAARESAGVHVAALAGALKIPVSKLEALENDDFAALPDAVFARALASSICRTLDVDPVPVLKLMPKNEVPNFSTASSDIKTSFKDSSRKSGKNSVLEYAMRPVGIAVVILLLGVLALLFIPLGGESPSFTEKITKTDVSTPDLQVIELSSTEVLATPEDIVIAEAIVEKSVESKIAESTLKALTPTELVAVLPDASLLEFRALGESWVQVRDATKAVVFERTLAKGDVASATGLEPLTVVIGRANMTEVFVRGKAFSLASVAKENVARFEVKQ